MFLLVNFFFKNIGILDRSTEVCFANFLSGLFTTLEVISPPERKLAKLTSLFAMSGFEIFERETRFNLNQSSDKSEKQRYCPTFWKTQKI